MRDGFYYVEVDKTTLPGGPAGWILKGDPTPNGTGQTCTTDGTPVACDSIWGDSSLDLNETNFDAIVNATGSEQITDVNFGYAGNPVIHGNVWNDVDGDTDWEATAGEEGIGSVTVSLLNCGADDTCGTADDGSTTTVATDADGYYSFANLSVGSTYSMTVVTTTLPAGGIWTQTAEDHPATGDASLDSQQMTVELSAGQISGAYDFGYTQNGTTEIGDTVYYDWDGDGSQDYTPGVLVEGGIPNVTVLLYEDEDGDGVIDPGVDAFAMSTTTSMTGTYLFEDLVAGDYIVQVDLSDPDLPAVFSQTQDPDEDGATCTTCDSQGSVDTTGASVYDIDFGYQPSGAGAIGDTVFRDMDGDGTQAGPRETGIADVTVTVEVDLNGDGTYDVLATTTTDEDGSYLFDDLPDGAYRVTVDTADTDLPNDVFDYDYVPSTDTSVDVTLSDGNTYLDADFGFVPLGAVGDTIYWDANGNGQQDWTEVGIGSGIVVTMTNTSAITVVQNGIPTQIGVGGYVVTTTTNITGTYLFTGLPAGAYTLTVGITDALTLTGRSRHQRHPVHGLGTERPPIPILRQQDRCHGQPRHGLPGRGLRLPTLGRDR